MDEIIVLKNIRRLVPKTYNKRTPNIVLVKEVLGLGNTSAGKKCEELGINPFDYSI